MLNGRKSRKVKKLSREEFLYKFASELHEIVLPSEYDYKILDEVYKDILDGKILPEEALDVLRQRQKEFFEKKGKK
ncbi:MAG: hypothetical protein ACFE8V_11110 [Promethearchaeota archaeon]